MGSLIVTGDRKVEEGEGLEFQHHSILKKCSTGYLVLWVNLWKCNGYASVETALAGYIQENILTQNTSWEKKKKLSNQELKKENE